MRDNLIKPLRSFATFAEAALVDTTKEIERLRANLDRARMALEQAQDCIRGETPEDMTDEEARADTISKIRAALSDD